MSRMSVQKRARARLRLLLALTSLGAAAPFALTSVVVPRGAAADASAALRVCGDPNNMPFSNEKREGLENEIASLVAKELGWQLEYVWWPQRRGFLRNTLNAERCDVVIGIPASVDMALTTRPYYRSSYVFVSRADRRLDVEAAK